MATHRFKSFDVDAWQFKGDLKKAPDWAVEKVNITEDKVEFTNPGGGIEYIETDWWLVRETNGNVIALPIAAFEHNYEEIPSVE